MRLRAASALRFLFTLGFTWCSRRLISERIPAFWIFFLKRFRALSILSPGCTSTSAKKFTPLSSAGYLEFCYYAFEVSTHEATSQSVTNRILSSEGPKGFFLAGRPLQGAARQQVRMQMKNALPGLGAIIDDHAKIPQIESCRHVPHGAEQLAQ